MTVVIEEENHAFFYPNEKCPSCVHCDYANEEGHNIYFDCRNPEPECKEKQA